MTKKSPSNTTIRDILQRVYINREIEVSLFLLLYLNRYQNTFVHVKPNYISKKGETIYIFKATIATKECDYHYIH